MLCTVVPARGVHVNEAACCCVLCEGMLLLSELR
jgi:hypothetical protein